MIPRGLLFAAALSLFILFFNSGCAAPIKAVIYDINGLQKEVSGVMTDQGDYIEVMDGLAFRKIKLRKISAIFISPGETLSRDGHLYYQTEMWLVDGTKILVYILPDGKRSSSYVNVNTAIVATANGDPYTIKLKDVKEIRFLVPQKKK